MRLSSYLAKQNNYSRRFVKELILLGKVTLDGTKIGSDIVVIDGGDYKIDIKLPKITYDLSDFLVKSSDRIIFLYKPPFMHTERQTPLDVLCLDDVVKGSFPEYRLISRLDYGVSGIVPALHKSANAKYEAKRYYAWVDGEFPEEYAGRWSVDAGKKRKVVIRETRDGRRMDFRCLKRVNGCSLVEVALASAARHQIRAVCAYLGYPIKGDLLYGSSKAIGKSKLTQRILLHCYEVTVNGVSAVSPYKGEFESLF